MIGSLGMLSSCAAATTLQALTNGAAKTVVASASSQGLQQDLDDMIIRVMMNQDDRDAVRQAAVDFVKNCQESSQKITSALNDFEKAANQIIKDVVSGGSATRLNNKENRQALRAMFTNLEGLMSTMLSVAEPLGGLDNLLPAEIKNPLLSVQQDLKKLVVDAKPLTEGKNLKKVTREIVKNLDNNEAKVKSALGLLQHNVALLMVHIEQSGLSLNDVYSVGSSLARSADAAGVQHGGAHALAQLGAAGSSLAAMISKLNFHGNFAALTNIFAAMRDLVGSMSSSSDSQETKTSLAVVQQDLNQLVNDAEQVVNLMRDIIGAQKEMLNMLEGFGQENAV
jgi:hypothetical protein